MRALTLSLLALLAAAAPAAAAPQKLVVAGDSYAASYQPTAPGGKGQYTKEGFADQLPGLAKARGYDLKLVNFACGGATTKSFTTTTGCAPKARAADQPSYRGRTQLAAVETYLRKHRGEVGVVLVSIGGNDVTACAKAANAVSCVGDAAERIERTVTSAAKRLRKAAGPDVKIIGLTYFDVILANYLSAEASQRTLAELSVIAFRDIINPALKRSYAAGRASFVDVTKASGAYIPFSQTVQTPNGPLPVAVARVCELAWTCRNGDIHPRTSGYTLIAQQIAKALPRR